MHEPYMRGYRGAFKAIVDSIKEMGVEDGLKHIAETIQDIYPDCQNARWLRSYLREEIMKNEALEILRELDGILCLEDMIYTVREIASGEADDEDREYLGWDEPKVLAWAKACRRMNKLLKEESDERW